MATINILILGEEGVGKRSYVKVLSTGIFDNIGVQDATSITLPTSVFDEIKIVFHFMLKRDVKMDAVIIMFDITNEKSYEEVRKCVPDVRQLGSGHCCLPQQDGHHPAEEGEYSPARRRLA